ncbi:MAG: FAD-dependent oxidoreductase [Alphaproteobacteria bacterium]|nr:FAD-dependent oxidoreductase [Alphaproteobacteria bacterium]MBO6865049.1 FAD-dependent oxidoreductase [Alphaproteobacteria bacterium]
MAEWKREPLSALGKDPYDVVIAGAGVNGASAAKTLTAEGYRVLIVDKSDFATGSSGRSSGLMHCGLRYLEPNPTFWNFVKRPDKLLVALKMARQTMRDRTEFARNNPDRAAPYASHFPIYKGSHYKLWQLRLGLWTLDFLAGRGGEPLDRAILTKDEVRANPLLRHMADIDGLAGVARFREIRFNWPERICLDMILDARHGGADARNHTAVTGMERDGDLWRVALRDGPTGEEGFVTARRVYNAAGIWIDRVNQASRPTAKRYIAGTKGAHIVVKLPPEMAGQGIVSLNSLKEPIYGIPWRGFHYFGPTETHYHGDPDAISVTEDEVSFLLREANALLPGLALKRDDVVFTWAGVRPLGFAPGYPEGKRSREIHDLTSEGLPGVYAMTAGTIMMHKSAGRAFLKVLRPGLAPSGPKRDVNRPNPAPNSDSPLLGNEPGTVSEAEVVRSAREEIPLTLTDLMVRRLGLSWTFSQGRGHARRVTEIAGPVLGWDDARIDAETEAYLTYLEKIHTVHKDAE